MSHALVHFEILAPDSTQMAKWYSQLFDWHIDADNPYGYPLVSSGRAGLSGGFSTASARSGTVLYFASTDLHQHLGRAEAAGGRGETPVVEVDGIRLARFIDVCGNVSGVWQTDVPLAIENASLQNPVVGFEIGGDQLLLAAFYRSIFGWNVDMASGTVGTASQPAGRIIESDRSFTSIVVSVPNVDEFAAANSDVAQGSVGDSHWPDGRRQLRCRDPHGNQFSVIGN